MEKQQHYNAHNAIQIIQATPHPQWHNNEDIITLQPIPNLNVPPLPHTSNQCHIMDRSDGITWWQVKIEAHK